MENIVLISRAWHFAAQRHASQKRKGNAQEPYVNHLAEVAVWAGRYGGSRRERMKEMAPLWGK
jgi:(p)ppGpp synthase/HD superfamily hydrolase